MLLPWLILIPFIGGFLCWQTERFGVKVPRWIALITMGLTLVLGLQLWMQGGYSLTQSAGIPQWQSEFVLPWIPRFGISIHLAIDGLSLLMVVAIIIVFVTYFIESSDAKAYLIMAGTIIVAWLLSMLFDAFFCPLTKVVRNDAE